MLLLPTLLPANRAPQVIDHDHLLRSRFTFSEGDGTCPRSYAVYFVTSASSCFHSLRYCAAVFSFLVVWSLTHISLCWSLRYGMKAAVDWTLKPGWQVTTEPSTPQEYGRFLATLKSWNL